MAKGLPIVLTAVLIAGCGAHKKRVDHVGVLYIPSAKHSHRDPGTIYPDEVGENIVGLATPYARVVKLFGPPLYRRAGCAYYRISSQPGRGWKFCFTGGRMTSATGNVKLTAP